MQRLRVSVMVLTLGYLLSGCTESAIGRCRPGDSPLIRIDFDEPLLELKVGETYTIREAYISCAHTLKWRDLPVSAIRWDNQNPEVGSIEAGTGKITALAPGLGLIGAKADYYGFEDMIGAYSYRVLPLPQ